LPVEKRVEMTTMSRRYMFIDGMSGEQARFAGVSLLLTSASVVLASLYFAGRMLAAAAAAG